MKKQSKILIISIILIVSLISFYKINELNYKKNQEIKLNIVKHPEYLPKKDIAVKTAFWFKNVKADFYRLETIQYIWWNAISSMYKKYLYQIIDIITELNPYFKQPYLIWQLLLPDYNKRYEDLDKQTQEKYIKQAIDLWQKWMKNFCDKNKIELIKKENNLIKIWTEDKYANPCKNYEIPNYLAYNYFYYKKQPAIASEYYKIASAVRDWLWWSKIMAAVMAWKWWNREKSFFMFLNLAKSVNTDKNNYCDKLWTSLENLWITIFNKKTIELNWKILDDIKKTRDNLFWKFNEEKEDKLLWDSSCINYINKAIRELNLEYIEKADKKYFEKYWKHSKNAKELYNKWFINYLPKDYQQYDDYWIIYEYNPETGFYDYNMWNYKD